MVAAVSNQTGQKASIGSALSRAQISSGDFMKILAAQLKNQDPLSPLSGSDFINQLVGLNTMEQTATLTDSLKQFQKVMQISFAGSFVGKVVSGVSTTGDKVVGKVDRVSIDKDGTFMIVDGNKIAVDGITDILPESVLQQLS